MDLEAAIPAKNSTKRLGISLPPERYDTPTQKNHSNGQGQADDAFNDIALRMPFYGGMME